MNNHKDWFDTTTEGATKAEVSAKTDIANSTIAHQYRAGQLSATTVIAIARAYGVNVIQALVDTKYIDPDDAILPDAPDVRLLEDRVLVAELARRINNQPAHWDGTFEEVFAHNGVDDSKPPLHLAKHSRSTPVVRSGWENNGIPDDAVADSSPEVGGTPDDYER